MLLSYFFRSKCPRTSRKLYICDCKFWALVEKRFKVKCSRLVIKIEIINNLFFCRINQNFKYLPGTKKRSPNKNEINLLQVQTKEAAISHLYEPKLWQHMIRTWWQLSISKKTWKRLKKIWREELGFGKTTFLKIKISFYSVNNMYANFLKAGQKMEK